MTSEAVKSGDQSRQIQAAFQMTAAVGNQTTNLQSGLRRFVATHSAVTFFDPPTDGTFGGIVGAIQDLATRGICPIPIKRETRP